MSRELRVDPDAVQTLADHFSAVTTEIATMSAVRHLTPATDALLGSHCGPALAAAAEALDASLTVVVTELHEISAAISASAVDYRTSEMTSSVLLAASERPI
ncbi:type VII secretion target [Rhodococcoides yunnanense]|jgi:hypothetical protein|uniref:type VII secretion target n=1 Tax=Rhodococcoides yunnanense TaxID=278209 RepID=UPI00353022F7